MPRNNMIIGHRLDKREASIIPININNNHSPKEGGCVGDEMTEINHKLNSFCGVTSSEYDLKLMEDAIIPFHKGVNSENCGITIDKYGEVFTFKHGGMYRFVIDLNVTNMSDSVGSLKLAINNNDNMYEYLTFFPIYTIGPQSSSTMILLKPNTRVSIRQTGQTEITIAAGSVKVEIYRVG